MAQICAAVLREDPFVTSMSLFLLPLCPPIVHSAKILRLDPQVHSPFSTTSSLWILPDPLMIDLIPLLTVCTLCLFSRFPQTGLRAWA